MAPMALSAGLGCPRPYKGITSPGHWGAARTPCSYSRAQTACLGGPPTAQQPRAVAHPPSDSVSPWQESAGLLCPWVSQARIWSRLPFPPSGDLPDPGPEPASPASPALAGGFLTTVPAGELSDATPSLYHSTLLKLRHTLSAQGPLLLII